MNGEQTKMDFGGKQTAKFGETIPEEQRARFKDFVMERLRERLSAFALHQMEPPDFENINQMFKADKD